MNAEILADLQAPELDIVNRKRLALVIRQTDKFQQSLIRQLDLSSRYVRVEKFNEDIKELCEKECKILASRLRSAISAGELMSAEEDEILKYTQELMVKVGISKIELRAIWDRAARS